MASIGPWAPPSVPVVPPAGGCGLNQTEATVFRPAPTKSVRATTADHSKPNLARLYGGAPSVLRPGLLERLRARLTQPPPDGGLWSSRKVAAGWRANSGS